MIPLLIKNGKVKVYFNAISVKNDNMITITVIKINIM